MKKIIVFAFFLYSCADKNANNNSPTSSAVSQSDAEGTDSKGVSNVYFRDTVATIYFESKSDSIKPVDILRLKELSGICASDSLGFLKVVGFTDTTGTENANDILSERRANEVYNLLDPHKKISKELVYVAWLGESKEVYDLHFHPTHPLQNCVDIWIQIHTNKVSEVTQRE